MQTVHNSNMVIDTHVLFLCTFVLWPGVVCNINQNNVKSM